MEEKANSRALKGPDTQAPHRLLGLGEGPMAPRSCLLTRSPDSELMVQTFFKKLLSCC